MKALATSFLYMVKRMLVQVCEMAAVMRMAVRLEEEREWEQRELLARLLTENKVASSLHRIE
jgi:hypothetical protein